MDEVIKEASGNVTAFLKSHETFQLALVEGFHRYYYDKCFTYGRNNRFKSDDESLLISAIHNNQFQNTPDWRYRLNKKTEQYIRTENSSACLLEYKPKRIISVDVQIILNESNP